MSRNSVVVPARQAPKPGGIGFWESILGSLKVYKFGLLLWRVHHNFAHDGTVDRVKGGGRTPPTRTRLGRFYHHDGMYARSGHCHSLCTLREQQTKRRCGGGKESLKVFVLPSKSMRKKHPHVTCIALGKNC